MQLVQVLNGSQHDCLGRELMSWDSSNSPFFSSPSQMHSIPLEMTLELEGRSLAASNGFVCAALTAQEQALRVLHAHGLHAPGLFTPLRRTWD